MSCAPLLAGGELPDSRPQGGQTALRGGSAPEGAGSFLLWSWLVLPRGGRLGSRRYLVADIFLLGGEVKALCLQTSF